MKRTLAILFPAALVALSVMGAQGAEDPEKSEETCNALFVHSADEVHLEADTLTMKGASPTVIFFCGRPLRFAGHLSVEKFLSSVTQGKDSFLEDPPNAAVSIISGEDVADVVVTLNEMPTVSGDDLVYSNVTILEGDLPGIRGPGTVFIDVIGRPMSPGSIAGVHRRQRQRAVRRCAAGVTCY